MNFTHKTEFFFLSTQVIYAPQQRFMASTIVTDYST